MTPPRASGLALLGALLLFAMVGLWLGVTRSGSPDPAAALPNDAYVWQRQWTPALASAVQANADLVRQWRVLAGQTDARGQWQASTPDWALLAASGRPIIAVLRIDGQLRSEDDQTLIERALDILQDWRQHGVTVAGLEIDHDCATARLPAYAHWLARLRDRLDPLTHLSITALPTWLDSTALDSVLAQVDEAVLQVHAVQNPRVGLFDPQAARRWLDAFATRVHTPWRVALPAYGSRVAWDNDGRVISIESERATLVGGVESHELMADPQAVQAFVRDLARQRPAGLAGIVWFRLPTAQDQRAWSPATWRAVLTQAPIDAQVVAQLRGTDDPHLFDLVLSNAGTGDGPMPATVSVDGNCQAADAINGYVLSRQAQGLSFQTRAPGLLKSGRQRAIGWLRCDNAKESLHVES